MIKTAKNVLSLKAEEAALTGESVPVNEKLSEIFLQLHISEKSGRGVPTILEVYGKEAFSFRDSAIILVLLSS